VQLHARQILDHIHEDMEIDPDARVLHAQIGQLARAAETSFSSTAILERELTELRQTHQQRTAQASKRRGHLQNGGVLRVEDAQAMVEEREAKLREQQQKRDEKAQRQAQKPGDRQHGSGMVDPALDGISFESMCSIWDLRS
ncbi:MAG: hypothetical protein M1823_003871, partial [Watsoniomyces obsoletus]